MNEKKPMDEKRAIAVLSNIRFSTIYHILNDPEDLNDIIEWLQRRADIIAAAETGEFEVADPTYIYDLYLEMKRQARIELECAIVFELQDCFERSTHYGELALKYFKLYQEKKDKE